MNFVEITESLSCKNIFFSLKIIVYKLHLKILHIYQLAIINCIDRNTNINWEGT